MSETNPEPQHGGEDNSTIRQMREKIESLQNDLKASKEENSTLAEKVTAAEREKMTEIERLQAELGDNKNRIADLTAYQGKAEKYEGFAKQQYEQRLASAPEDIRSRIEGLSSVGDWADRLGALDNALQLVDTVKPKSAGTKTEPAPPEGPNGEPTGGGKKEPQPFDPKRTLADSLALARNK